MNTLSTKTRGFTLIEILVVIGIIAILATIVIVAINPARQFAQANNTTRTSNVNTILNAIGQELADNKGVFNAAGTGCPALPTSMASTQITVGAVGFDLACLVPTYVSNIPFDPTTGNASTTGYFISTDATGRVTVSAPSTQMPPAPAVISVTR